MNKKIKMSRLIGICESGESKKTFGLRMDKLLRLGELREEIGDKCFAIDENSIHDKCEGDVNYVNGLE